VAFQNATFGSRILTRLYGSSTLKSSRNEHSNGV
jgi:hypothetical protein